MAHFTFISPDGFDVVALYQNKQPITGIIPIPSLDKEYVTNMEILFNHAARWAEKNNPGKECIGCEQNWDEKENRWVLIPVLIDKR